MKPLNIDDLIASPDAYAAAIQKVYDKKSQLNRAFTEAHGGVNYYGTYLRFRSLARVMASTVAQGDYRCSPVGLRELRLRKKTRLAHLPTFPDQIVSSVVYRVISNNAQYLGLPGVYSYLPGTSNYLAMQDFARYVRNHRREVRDVRQRGLFVLQSDFEKYGDNLPVHPNAYIWGKLREVVDAGSDDTVSDDAWALIQSLVRPVVRDNDGSEFTRLYGIPMGAPIVPMVNNLAAAPLDDLLANWDGAFYARFNDDFLFVHPERSVVIEADAKLDELLEPLGVRRHRGKDIRSFFNGAGLTRPGDEEFRGRNRIDLLGLSVSFDGTIALGPARIARIMAEVCRRLDLTAMALADLPLDERARRLVAVANNMLTPGHSFAVSGAGAILRDTTDRNMLKDLDYRIARKIVQVATGQPGVRGFRQLTVHDLRERWGLVSFVKQRNSR